MIVMERYLTVEEVAKGLQVSEETVRRYIKRKALVAYKIGGEYRVYPADLKTFMEARKTTREKS